MSEMQATAKKKQNELEGKLKSSANEVAKLNEKLSEQEHLVVKKFGVENEMVTLRSTILEKDN